MISISNYQSVPLTHSFQNIQGVSEKVCLFEICTLLPCNVSKSDSSPKVVKMRQIGTFLLLKDLHERLLGRFEAKFWAQKCQFLPRKISFFLPLSRIPPFLDSYRLLQHQNVVPISQAISGELLISSWTKFGPLTELFWPRLPTSTLFGE